MPSVADRVRSYSARPGAVHVEAPAPEPIAQGLELSDIMYKPREWFHLNPANEVFRAYKSEQYLADLERDIAADGITTPLLAQPDGLIWAGESRWIVTAPERANVERLPVRIILSASPEALERRLLLDNLLRFEIPRDARLVMLAKVWPGYLGGDTVSPLPRVGGEPKRREIAEAMGVSERQAIREAGIMREATAKAKAEGREASVEDVAEARESRNAKRRSSASSESPAILRVRQVVEKLRAEADRLQNCTGSGYLEAKGYRAAANMIEEALR